MLKQRLSIQRIVLSLLILLVAFMALIWYRQAQQPLIVKNPGILKNNDVESSPFVWDGQLKYLSAERATSQLVIYDVASNESVAGFSLDLSMASAVTRDKTLYVSGTRKLGEVGMSGVYTMTTQDLTVLKDPVLAIKAKSDERFFNSSIVYNNDTRQWIMLVEVGDAVSPHFHFNFFSSPDFVSWQPVVDAVFPAKDQVGKIYAGAPTLKYLNHQYYLWSLVDHPQDNMRYTTVLSRSSNLVSWEAAKRPFMVPDQKDEGSNVSDVDLVDFKGKAYITYAVGDQQSWANLKSATSFLPLSQLVLRYFR